MTQISDFFLKLDLLGFLQASQSQFTRITIKVLDENSFLIFVEFGPHDSQSDCLYDICFDFFFLDGEHLCGLGVAGLLDVLEESGYGFDFDFSGYFLFL